ncbi:MAG: class I SAM-dependent methyltransferase [Acidobacteriia bacterium]|nr:class I SAM-dependent methyltransferase [Terriglobia bacterium]
MSKENIFDFKAKFRFARKLIRHRLQRQPRVCPYCGPSSTLRLIHRKKLIMDILQCETCHLIIRWPTDTPQEHDLYYQQEFAEDSPQVILPTPEELRALVQNDFLGSPLDINHKIRVLKALRPAGRVLDFGCSWAYGTYQFQRHGFDATGFEISKPRADHGRKNLGQKVIDSYEELHALPPASFDIIFTNHVVEHLPGIRNSLSLLAGLLSKDGFVFHVLPNFTGKRAKSGFWLKWIGEDHPIAPTIDFFEYAIPRSGLLSPVFGSSPFDENLIAALTGQPGAMLSTDGDELLVYAHKAAF